MAAIITLILLATVATAFAGVESCNRDADVLILGAGISGLRAAESFHDAGTSFIILEQSDRIGGRIRSEEFAGATIEQGAQWILATDFNAPNDTKNPILLLAEQCGLQYRPEPFQSLGVVYYDRNGNDITSSPEVLNARARFNNAARNAVNVYFELQGTEEDLSLEAAWRIGGWEARSPLEEVVENLGSPPDPSDIIGLRGNTLSRLSARDFGNVTAGLVVTDPRGYIHLVNCFTERFLEENDTRIHLNTVVTRINWGRDDCVCATVTEKGGSEREYCGSYAVVTFSVGVLQSGIIEFEPQPPRLWRHTVQRTTMAHFLRLYAQFNNTFWDTNVDMIGIVDETQPKEFYPRFIPQGSYLDGQPPILQAFLSGDFALRVLEQDPEITRQQISKVMRNVYGDRASDAVSVSMHGFITSPYFRGNLPQPNVGFLEQSYNVLAGPLGRMYFAGDGTIGKYHASVHGAYISGRNTAERILQDIADSAACK